MTKKLFILFVFLAVLVIQAPASLGAEDEPEKISLNIDCQDQECFVIKPLVLKADVPANQERVAPEPKQPLGIRGKPERKQINPKQFHDYRIRGNLEMYRHPNSYG